MLSPTIGFAAEIAGRVVDAQGLPVIGAQVRLFSGSGERPRLAATVVTNYEGRFRLPDAGALPGFVEVSSPGFERLRRTLSDAGANLELRLRVAGVHEGVVVTATREETDTFDAPLAAALVSGDLLEGTLPTNLAQALEDVPGVNWINAGAFRSRPVIRGLTSNRVLVLVDGERLNNSRTSTNDAGIETSLLDVSQISQVEVVKGPGSVLYGGDAFGGVVNIRSRSVLPSETFRYGARVRNELFSTSYGRRTTADIFASRRWLSLRASGHLSDFENYDSPLGTVFGSGVDENGGLGELRVYPARQQSFFFKFLHKGAYDFGLPSLESDPVFLATFPFSKLTKLSGGYDGNYNSNTLSALQVRFYQQDQTRDFQNLLRLGPTSSLFSDTVTDIETFGIDIQATSIAARRHVLTYGLTYYRDRNRDQRIQILNPQTSHIVLSQAPSVPDSSLAGAGLFLQDQFQVSGRFRLIGGLRFDHFSLEAEETPNFDPNAFSAAESRTDNAVTGNAGATFEVLSGWLLTANVARAFREPNLFERYFFGRGSVGGFVVPNPNLEPETSVQFDVGTRVSRGPARLSLYYFLNRLDNLIVPGPGIFQGQTVIGGQPVTQNFNVDESRIQGIESTAELFLNGLGSQWNPAVTLAWQRGTNLTYGQPLPLIAPFISNVSLRWQPRPVRAWAEWRSRIVKGSDRVPAGSQPLAGFATHGLRWGYELMRGENGAGAWVPRGIGSVDFHFGLENVMNRAYRNLFEVVPEPGRAFRFGIALNLDSTAH